MTSYGVEPGDTQTLTPVVDQPRKIDPGVSTPDFLFRNGVRGVGLFVMVLVGAIGVFLGYKIFGTIHHYGFGYFTRKDFNPGRNIVGIAAAVTGTIEVAIIALVIAFPLAITSALYISEYAPPRLRSLLISTVDLMAAVPSIIYGVWGFFFLMPHLLFVSRWLNEWLGFLPWFDVQGVQPRAPSLLGGGRGDRYTGSAFIAGTVVALMVIPLACSLMRNVFAQAPIGEREGAYALGASRWGMIRTVVLPFGRGGIIGAMMLGLGRALGETVAVLLIINLTFEIKVRVLETGGITISSLIASKFEAATGTQLAALLAAGFVLFVITLVVNTLAAIVVGRSRSGAGVDL